MKTKWNHKQEATPKTKGRKIKLLDFVHRCEKLRYNFGRDSSTYIENDAIYDL